MLVTVARVDFHFQKWCDLDTSFKGKDKENLTQGTNIVTLTFFGVAQTVCY